MELLRHLFKDINAITVDEGRIRKEFDPAKLAELEESIFLSGQLQPIVVDDDLHLICGERRLRALRNLCAKHKQGELDLNQASSVAKTQIGNGWILCVHREDLTGQEALEAELAENLRRVDLTWQEQAAAVKQLHTLRVEQKGVYNPGTRQGQTLRATAEEIVGDGATANDVKNVHRDNILAEYLDDPFVAAAKDPNEALRLVKKLEKEKDLKERSEKFDLTSSPHTVQLGNGYTWMAEPALQGAADVIITDPPYGRDMHKQGMANEHEYDDSREAWEKWIQEMPLLLYNACKPQAHVYIFMDLLTFTEAQAAMIVAGFDVWPRPIIWDKQHIGSFGNIEYGPRHCYDAILFANKGNRETVIHSTDVISIAQDTALAHPAGKPVALLGELLKRSARPGDVVLDPMVGGGTLFPAATYSQVTAHGCEMQEKYFMMAQEAIQETIE